jgi:hypothetical protein
VSCLIFFDTNEESVGITIFHEVLRVTVPVEGDAPYGPPYSSNVFRPPGVPTTSHFIAPSRFAAACSAASTPTASAVSSSKAAEVLAQQQAAEDKKRGYPTIKGKGGTVQTQELRNRGTQGTSGDGLRSSKSLMLSLTPQWLCDGRSVALNVDNFVKIFDALHHRLVAAACSRVVLTRALLQGGSGSHFRSQRPVNADMLSHTHPDHRGPCEGPDCFRIRPLVN